MTQLFETHTDGIIWMDANKADRFAGGLVAWEPDGDGLSPTGTTWNQDVSAKLRFTFTVDTTTTYKLYVYGNTRGKDAWTWVNLDGRIDLIGAQSFYINQLGRIKFNIFSDEWKVTSNAPIPLTAGKHIIEFDSISEHMIIERIAIVPDSDSTLENDILQSGGPSVTTGDNPIVDGETFVGWMDDDTRNPFRVLLIELDFPGGALRFGSQPYLSNKSIPYDDGLISSPFIEELLSRGDENSVGDIEVVLEDPEFDPRDVDFRGYPCRMYFGDGAWNIDQFRLISTSTITACKMTGFNKFQFDLISSTDLYSKTFHVGEDLVRDGTLDTEIAWLLEQFEGASAIKFVNVESSDLYNSIRYTVTENTTIDEVLTHMCNTFGGYYRTSLAGLIEFVVPDSNTDPALKFNTDNIIQETITEVEVFPAYKTVTVVNTTLYDENDSDPLYRISVDTEVDSGSYNEEIIIECSLKQSAKLEEMANLFAERYGKKRTLYSMDVVDFADVSIVGDYVTITSLSINTTGIIDSIRRTPLTATTTIEVLV